MLNQIILVGRLVDNPLLEETENGKNTATIMLAVSRAFKNDNGEYETDFIPCIICNNVADKVKEYYKKGDLLGIKGKIQTRQEEDKNIIEIVAEKVTFLSNRKETEVEVMQ